MINAPACRRRERVMETAAECHQYAEECVRWAARAKTEEQRKGFLEIAHAWKEAALLLESNDFAGNVAK
jgi:hypothetical protein